MTHNAKTFDSSHTVSPMKIYIHVLLIFAFCAGCKEEEGISDVHDPLIRLSVVDTTTTEISLRLVSSDQGPGRNVFIRRDSSPIFGVDKPAFDTVFVDRGLLPNRLYTYWAYRVVNEVILDSVQLRVRTADTTSHDFSWQVFRFGDGVSSLLRDVAFINDTCIWAVGEIYRQDSAGAFPTRYNAVEWNGRNWQLHRIPTRSTGGSISFAYLVSVIGFSASDIWVFGEASYSHWDGSQWLTQLTPNHNGGANKVWGTSSSNFYIVGSNGEITHFDGTDWKSLETGTTLEFRDIWGAPNAASGKLEILAVATNPPAYSEWKIVSIEKMSVREINQRRVFRPLNSVWFVPGKRYYVAGVLIYYKKNLADTLDSWSVDRGSYETTNFKTSIRGNATNDYVIATDGGELLHSNGYSWRNFQKTEGLDVGHVLHEVYFKGNVIVAAGTNSGYGIIAIGRRQH